MNAALRLVRGRDAGFRLETKPRKRAVYAVVLVILAVGIVVGWDPARDLGPRAPGTVFYMVLMVGSLVAALANRVVSASREGRSLSVSRRIGGLEYGRQTYPTPEGSVVRLRQETRRVFVLELQVGGETIVLDASSWKSEIEPMAKAVAEALDLPYEA